MCDNSHLLWLNCCPLHAKIEIVFLEVLRYYRCQYFAQLWFVDVAEPHICWCSK